MSSTRRRLLVGALSTLPASLALAQVVRMTEGPFYPDVRWRGRNAINTEDWDADLTQVRRGSETLRARGEILGLQLQVVDRQGRRVDGCEVEIWQCDALTAYRHPNVAADPGSYDPGFQGFGMVRSDREGTATFRTIRPVPYPGRTPHIHVKLRHTSFGEVTSQLFVAGDPGNARDFLWGRLGPAERETLALKLEPASGGLRWQAQQRLLLPA